MRTLVSDVASRLPIDQQFQRRQGNVLIDGLEAIGQRKENEPLDNGHPLGVLNHLAQSAQLLAAFSRTSAIGLAIIDNQIRFRSVNNALAVRRGVPVEAHSGNRPRDIFGIVAAKSEAALRQYWSPA